MRFSKQKTALVFITAFVILLTGLIPCAAQESTDAQEICSALQTDGTRLICVSKYGETQSYPENSAQGVVAAAEAGADMVLVSVKKTSDGEIVLMADDNLSRMCVDSEQNPVDKSVSEVGYYEINAYFLKNGSGGAYQSVTAYTVPTLRETLEALGGKAMLLIDGGWEFRDDIYSVLSDMNALNSAVIVADGKKKEVSQWLLSKTSKPLVFSKYTGNVVWSSGSYIKQTVSAGVLGVILGDNNSHSTSFSASTVEKLEGKARAVIDMTSSDLCGGRQDAPLGWDDVTSRGFSVIITNNISQLCEYRQRVELARERLNEMIENASGVDVTLLSTVAANNLSEAVSDAQTVSETSVSAMTLESSLCALRDTLNSLSDSGSDDGKTVTSGRIAAAVIVTAALIGMEIAFEYFRKKKVAARRQGKKRRNK